MCLRIGNTDDCGCSNRNSDDLVLFLPAALPRILPAINGYLPMVAAEGLPADPMYFFLFIEILAS